METITCPPKYLCLLGGILMKIGGGIVGCWGNSNMYYFSTFHQQGYHITSATNSIILLLAVFAMIIIMCAAPCLGDRFGYVRISRISAAVFLFSPQLASFTFGLYPFIMLCLVMPVCAFGLSIISIIKCVWEFYPSSRNKVTAWLSVAYGLGVFLWSFVFMHMMNPENEEPAVRQGQIMFFSERVTENVRTYSRYIFLLSGLLFLAGSFLIRKQQPAGQPGENQAEKQPQTQHIQLQQEGQQKQRQPSASTEDEFNLTNQQDYWMAVKDVRFVLLLVICLLFYLYQIYLLMYLKIIYQSIISDDHFLSYCVIVSNVVAIVAAFAWGWLADRKGFQFSTLLICLWDLVVKVYSWWAVDEGMVMGLFVGVGVVSKSLGIVVGPAYVEMFGLETGTNLLPFKAVALTLGFIIVPFMQIITESFLSPLSYLHVLSVLSIVTFTLSLILYFRPSK